MNFHKIDSETFSFYNRFFNNGSVLKIQKTGNNISAEIESSELWICDNRDEIPLSTRNTLYGILHFQGTYSIKKDKQEVSTLKMEYDYGGLMDFNLTKNSLYMCGSWVGFGTNTPKEETWFEIEIKAREIYWENTADTQDPTLRGKHMGIPGRPPFGEYP